MGMQPLFYKCRVATCIADDLSPPAKAKATVQRRNPCLSWSGFHADVSDAEQPEPYWRDIKGYTRSRLDRKQGRHDDEETHHEPVRQGSARHPEGDAVRPALMHGLLVTPVGQHDDSPGPKRANQCDARHPYEYLVRHQEIEQNTDQHEGCRDGYRCCRKASPVNRAERRRGLADLRKSMKHSPGAVEPTIAR